jgi:hypothetical protein
MWVMPLFPHLLANLHRKPHVLPFFGASITASPPFIVSRYMKNGNAMFYLHNYPNANRTKIVSMQSGLLVAVINGCLVS